MDVPFHKRIIGNFRFFEDRRETNLFCVIGAYKLLYTVVWLWGEVLNRVFSLSALIIIFGYTFVGQCYSGEFGF